MIFFQFCFVPLFVYPSTVGQMLLNLKNLGQSLIADGKGCLKMSKLKILSASKAKKLLIEKSNEFCGTS